MAKVLKFGTFTGVFTPTLLTILGVIMYQRLGWMVGNAGLGGALLIMGLAIGITTCTGLSLSSIATNTRIGDGGPYAIISKSLGLEVGGSIGIPLFLTRPLGVAMYVFGFREGWLWFFPEHPAIAVDLIVLAIMVSIAWWSAGLAFKTQYIIMCLIVLSLASIFASPALWFPEEPIPIQWLGAYPGSIDNGFNGDSFWTVFAVFFPATTGILAGANMSGDLENPRRSIPRGTIWAIVLSTIIYLVVAWACARMGTPDELVGSYYFLTEQAAVPELVIVGLLGATFSSALAGLVGGPRILMAMGEHRIVPMGGWLATRAKDGEPRNALMLTAALTVAAVCVRDLNAIAPIVTMFFLITYSVINLVVLVENGLGLISFRPTLQIPTIVPLVGLVGCIFSMFIVNPTFGLIAIGVVFAIYASIQRRGINSDTEDMRSSIFVALAAWAASKVTEADQANVRAWKPHLLVPFEDPERLRGGFGLLLHLARPEGSLKLLGLTRQGEEAQMASRVRDLCVAFRDRGVFCTGSQVSLEGYVTGIGAGLMALQSAFFRPNLLLLTVPDVAKRMEDLRALIEIGRQSRVGVALVAMHPYAGLGQQERVHLWVRPPQGSWSADDAFNTGSLNLILLMGLRVMRTWNARVTIITAIQDDAQRDDAQRFLADLCELVRFPRAAKRTVITGTFPDCLEKVPPCDLTILGLLLNAEHDYMTGVVKASRSTCFFVLDSGRESARA